MQIIAYSGVAKSNYVEAVQLAKRLQFEDAYKKINDGDEVLKIAHENHMVLLQREAKEQTPQVSMMVLHAEDQFMSCETVKILALEVIELYKRIENK